MVDNPAAPAGQATKYARREYERRFLLARCPEGRSVRTVVICDRYIAATRLRLRRMDQVAPAGQPAVFKLTQKVMAGNGGPGLITTTYLTESEFEVFATLPAAVLTKTRYSIPPFGVDVFGGGLAGLLLAEAEFETEAECQTFTAPGYVVAEVTCDVRFTGGQLATTDAVRIRETLRSFGVDLE